MILAALVLAAVTANIRPEAPKVGDLITVEFSAPVTLDRSPSYEVVRREGNRVIVRTFEPKPFTMSGIAGNERFENVVVPVRSVLTPNDSLEPAPLAPPVELPMPRLPFIAIGLAALAAVLAWTAVRWRAQRDARPIVIQPQLSPAERFRNAVIALQGQGEHPRRWAALADETRIYLAATRDLGSELTTAELVPQLTEREHVVVDILRNGDFEKFAPRGTPQADFDEITQRALAL
jgi:hypothetical protein